MQRRTHYLINKKFQLIFAAKFALITALVSGFVGFQLYATVWPVVTKYVPAEVMTVIKQQIFFRGILFLSLGALLIIALSVVLFHRVAGPIFAMKRTIDQILKGEAIELIRLRKHDEFKDLAEKINGLIQIIKDTRESPPAQAPSKE